MKAEILGMLYGKPSPYAKDLETFQRWTGLMHRHIDGGDLTPQGSLPGAAMGICGELGELVEGTGDILVFEAGDVLSYVYIMTEVLGLDGSGWIALLHLNDPAYCYHHYAYDVPRRNLNRWPKGALSEAVLNGLRISELTKKRTIQGRPISAEAFETPLRTLVQQISVYLGSYGISMRAALELNVQKLTIRYPHAAQAAAEAMKLPRRVDHPRWYGFVDPGGPFAVPDCDDIEDEGDDDGG